MKSCLMPTFSQSLIIWKTAVETWAQEMNGGTNWGLGELGNYTLTPEHRMKVRTLKVHREVCTSTDERAACSGAVRYRMLQRPLLFTVIHSVIYSRPHQVMRRSSSVLFLLCRLPSITTVSNSRHYKGTITSSLRQTWTLAANRTFAHHYSYSYFSALGYHVYCSRIIH